MLVLMKWSSGGITHEQIMRMPWVTFTAYLEAIEEQNRKENDAKHFKKPHLQDEWEQNREEWLKAQPRKVKACQQPERK